MCLFPPSSVVTEFCEVFSCCSDWEDVVPQSFSFSMLKRYEKQTSESASTIKKKNGAAYNLCRIRMILLKKSRCVLW